MKNLFKQPKTISRSRRQLLESFQKKVNIRFKNIELLDTAFHHRSFSNEVANLTGNNERLEFLGDSVLGLIVANYLYSTLETEAEGDLAKIKAVVVSESTLSNIAVQIGIDTCLSLGRGEEKSGGRSKKAILADALEAVIGSYYLDSGLKDVEKFVLQLMKPEIDKVHKNTHVKDYKTLLQEFYQKKYKAVPQYKMDRKTGPDHDQTFWVSVSLGATTYGPTSGKSKKEAEQSVARFAWESINS